MLEIAPYVHPTQVKVLVPFVVIQREIVVGTKNTSRFTLKYCIDAIEYCPGNSFVCPADSVFNSTHMCRNLTGSCDI